jgi:hypothetical protein
MKLKAYDVAFTVPPITSNYLMSPESDVVFVRLLADCVVGMSDVALSSNFRTTSLKGLTDVIIEIEMHSFYQVFSRATTIFVLRPFYQYHCLECTAQQKY